MCFGLLLLFFARTPRCNIFGTLQSKATLTSRPTASPVPRCQPAVLVPLAALRPRNSARRFRGTRRGRLLVALVASLPPQTVVCCKGPLFSHALKFTTRGRLGDSHFVFVFVFLCLTKKTDNVSLVGQFHQPRPINASTSGRNLPHTPEASRHRHGPAGGKPGIGCERLYGGDVKLLETLTANCPVTLVEALLFFGNGSKLDHQKAADFSPWFHYPGLYFGPFGYPFSTHTHLFSGTLPVPFPFDGRPE